MELLIDDDDMRAFFQTDALRREGKARHASYANAEPFPHIVMDDFFPEKVIREVARSIPEPSEGWVKREREVAVKLGLRDETLMPPVVRTLIHELNSGPFLEFLEELTGIEGLISDPYLLGGGVHQVPRGGFLKIHADFNRHDRLKLHRRLNLLLYLNEDWDDSYGGHLELWDAAVERCYEKALPALNRTVIFNTTDRAMHGHPHPLTCPEGRARKSIALYYYSAERPVEEITKAHGVLYRPTPDEAAAGGFEGAAPPPPGSGPRETPVPAERRFGARLRRFLTGS